VPTPKTISTAADSKESDTEAISRRDFIAAAGAKGIAMGVGQSAAASPQVLTPQPESTQASVKPEIYMGTPSGAVLAQLRAAGIRTLFHTNTSGFMPFWEAKDAAGDAQVINRTHEGHGDYGIRMEKVADHR